MLFTNTLFSKIMIIFILSLTAIALSIFLQEKLWTIGVWSTVVLIFAASMVKHLLYPLHCLTDLCNRRSAGSVEEFMCQGSDEDIKLAHAIKGLIESHQHLCDQKQDIFKEAAHELKSPIAILKARISLFTQKEDGDKKLFAKEAQADLEGITLKLKELLFLKEVEWEMQQVKESFYIQDQCDIMRVAFGPILEKKGLSITNASTEDFALHVHKQALAKVMQAIFENIFYHTKNNTTIETTVNAKNRSLQIKNIIGSKSDDTLFSSAIGMKIIQRISEKLHYTYTTTQEDDIYITSITFI